MEDLQPISDAEQAAFCVELVKRLNMLRGQDHLCDVREGTFFIGGGGGVGRGILEFFCLKRSGPPTSQIGLMHDPS